MTRARPFSELANYSQVSASCAYSGRSLSGNFTAGIEAGPGSADQCVTEMRPHKQQASRLQMKNILIACEEDIPITSSPPPLTPEG